MNEPFGRFGSASSGEPDRESDIDLLVVRPAAVDPDDPIWRQQVNALESAAASWPGNDACVLEYGADELVGGEPVLDTAAAEGVELYGSLRRVLRTARRRRA